jgi:hypothetical protein
MRSSFICYAALAMSLPVVTKGGLGRNRPADGLFHHLAGGPADAGRRKLLHRRFGQLLSNWNMTDIREYPC